MRNDGGPAFPLYCGPGDTENTSGMSLRDYFAAKAMQAYVSSYPEGNIQNNIKFIALDAYDMADAMLKARENSNA